MFKALKSCTYVVPMLYHKKKTPVNTEVFNHSRDPGGILTPDRWSRNPVLYTAELRSRFACRSAEILKRTAELRSHAN